MALINDIDSFKKFGSLPAVPDYIYDNLAYELREYQKEAIGRYLFLKDKPEYNHLLWQMATGSGKTLIMAALILEMYMRGYRNFWFFVTSTNIITKTIDNFTNSAAKKYQFAPKIEIDGRQVEIRQVENFDLNSNDYINIKFSTINILHQISQPEMMSENAVSLDDFSEMPLVLIGDEAHHLNAATKKEKDEESTWENSVQLVLKANPANRLFEFTATANLTNEAIARKYSDKLLYNYDLRHFRNDRFSKDVFTQSIDIDLSEIERIMLRTILISQYRKHIALDNGINLKPVILFKSKGNTENSRGTEVSKGSYDKFNAMMRNLSEEQIRREFETVDLSKDDNSKIWHKTVKYFSNKETTHATALQDLISELKIDFDVDTNRVLIHDGTNKRRDNQDKLVNTLEENDNPVRAIFAVNVLDEGWDVLNLFDIVRLYDTRDGNTDRNGGYKPGNGTISEAQLIGRGARYFPFQWKDTDKYRRKFDENEAEPLRAIEQMHYHCRHNSNYIYEIRHTLIESGIMANMSDMFEYDLIMKDEYKDVNSPFQQKSVFENAVLPKKDWRDTNIKIVENELIEQEILEIPDFTNDEPLTIRPASGEMAELQVFAPDKEGASNSSTEKVTYTTVAETIPAHILRFAINCNKNFTFDKLKIAYPKLESMTQFIELLGKKEITVVGVKHFSPTILLQIAGSLLKNTELGVKTEQKKVYVTKHFEPMVVCERFSPYITRKAEKSDSEVGKSQNNPYNEKYRLDLSSQEWYVYNDNYGTSEEKSFVRWFADFVPMLKDSGWKEISLARNEKAVKLYSWFKDNLGEGFEPDFVLFMKKDGIDYVYYIEPKGDWSYDATHNNFGKEQWKEDLLKEIENVVRTQHEQTSRTEKWRVIGLPFYNETRESKKATKRYKADLFDV
jgi:type III restriction enzyme